MKNADGKLFAGEKLLIIVALLGFLFAAICGAFAVLNGEVVLPEGNLKDAFSFNAAVAMFMLSIAAILPLSGLTLKKRLRVRYGLAGAVLLSYGIETVQNFRGVDPRYTKTGSIADIAIGGFFGFTTIGIIVLTVMLAKAFFKNDSLQRILLITGIRYAFLSVMLSFAAGAAMIGLQSRFIGTAGNFIVVHGVGFHALQALPVLAWLLERRHAEAKRSRTLVHIGGILYCSSVLLLGIQTVLGRTVFEFTLLPVLSVSALMGYGVILAVTLIASFRLRLVRSVRSADSPD